MADTAAVESKQELPVFVVIVREVIKGNAFTAGKHYTLRAICKSFDKAKMLAKECWEEYDGACTVYVNVGEYDSLDSAFYDDSSPMYTYVPPIIPVTAARTTDPAPSPAFG